MGCAVVKPIIREDAAEPLFAFDRQARDLFVPYRRTPVIEALKKVGQAGDQPQLRILCAGAFALGLVRSDPRMMRAARRMLLSHELATLAKSAIKHRIDRARPRSAAGDGDHKPTPGHSSAKEDTSFPSGHSAGAMAVACAFAAVYPEHRAKALAAGGSIGLVQVPTCAHYPSDVAVGLSLGAAVDFVVGVAWRRIPFLND